MLFFKFEVKSYSTFFSSIQPQLTVLMNNNMSIGTNNWGCRNYINKLEKGSIHLGKSMFLATISCQFKVIVSFKNIPEQNCSVLVPCLNSKSVKDIQMLRKVAQMTTILTIKSSFI